MPQIGNLSLRVIKAIEEDRVEIFMIHIIMIEEIIKIDIEQRVDIEKFSLVDKVEVDQGMSKIIGMIIGEELLGKM